MSKFKQIAILVGQADEYNQSRFLKGFLTKGFEYDFNVCIFSMYRKYQDNSVREKGESNIFKLVDYPSYDAIVLLKDTIQTADVAKKLEEDIHACYDGPVVVIEQESEYFQSISSDSYDSMYELVSHMIEEHGYRDIAFLAGKKNHIHSIIRLEAYCACLKDHGIAVDKNRIEYGDFWYRSGEQYADRLMLDPDHLPEAVVCANDCMAIGLCRTLTRHGVKIPEDIAVAGYDSNQEGKTSPLILTSMETPAYECGVYTSDYLHGQFSGTTIEAFHKTGTLIAGESCGCRLAATDNRISRRKSWSTETSRDGFMSINNTMYEDLMLQSNLRDYLSTVYSYAYQLRGIESFHLFLNESYVFLDENPVIHCANDGYSEKMIYAIRYNRNGMNSMISTENRIERKNILPELSESAPGPAAYFFTPVFFENECFGYSIISYGSVPTSYDEIYRLWIKCVARGFESLKRNIRINQLEQNEKFAQSKFGNYRQSDIDKLSEEERKELHLVEHILDDNMLTYHFQPIVNTRDGEIYSYEALMRATTEEKISPLVIIKYANMLDRLDDVERATFLNVLTLVGEHTAQIGSRKVFINRIPGVRINDTDYSAIADMLEKYSDIAVVELTEEAELTDEDLAETKDFFERLHIETAIDDYGTGYSNVSNLLRYMPDYVKIDRSLLSNIQNEPQKQHFVREIIEFCHSNNILALAEGIETTEELQVVIHLGADLIQGYYTARPAAQILQRIDDNIRREIKLYRQELIDGKTTEVYIAGKTNRISLRNLVKDGCTDILIGADNMVYNDLSIIGTPGLTTNIHVRISPGYKGRVTLENVHLSNIKNRPAIELAENSDVTLILNGENHFVNSGILVPESAALTLEGTGDLNINLDAPEFYGIGNDLNTRHGDIILNQDGTVHIKSTGKSGVCIGSGPGGNIEVKRGHYIIDANVENGVGIGSIQSDVKLSVTMCLIEGSISAKKAVFIGSYRGNTDLSMSNCRIDIYMGAFYNTAIGTYEGNSGRVDVCDAAIDITSRSENSTALGSYLGNTVLTVLRSSLVIDGAGSTNLSIGGYEQKTSFSLEGTDIRVNIHNNTGSDTYATPEDISILRGRAFFKVNDQIIQREIRYK